jgi:hypothetical protein
VIYKRCGHSRGRQQDACGHPWYGSFKTAGHPRVRVALTKWMGTAVHTRREALAAFDVLKARSAMARSVLAGAQRRETEPGK